MTCREAQALLWEVAGGELAGAPAEEVRAHAHECAACAAALEELETAVALGRRVGQEPLPDGFALELRRKLIAAGPPRRAWWPLATARPLALALGVAALAVVALWVGHRTGRPVAVAATRVPGSKVALVKIDFVAQHAVEDVQFEVMLPDGLRFVSRGEELSERSFRWNGRLVAGSNPIPIAVRGPRAGRYRLIAHAIGRNLDVTHEVLLDVTT